MVDVKSEVTLAQELRKKGDSTCANTWDTQNDPFLWTSLQSQTIFHRFKHKGPVLMIKCSPLNIFNEYQARIKIFRIDTDTQ